jgi:predicted MFS family arabinose efflux permease
MKDKQLQVYKIMRHGYYQTIYLQNITAVNARFICYTYLALILNNFYYFSESYLIYL